MPLLWPSRHNPAGGFNASMGRVIHWIFVASACVVLVVAVNWRIQQQRVFTETANREAASVNALAPADRMAEERIFGPDIHTPQPPSNDELYMGLTAAVLLMLAGRAARYILSAE
jgi:hypothetical protein